MLVDIRAPSSMRRREDRYPRLKRRALILGGMQAGLLGLIGARLYRLQSVETDKYRLLADGNRLSTRPLWPARGLIFDRTGRALTANRSNFRLLMTPYKARSSAGAKLVEAVLDRVGRVLVLGEHDRRQLVDQIRQTRGLVPVEVRENLSWDELARIEFNTPDLPGISIELGQSREYLDADLMSHIVGYVGRVSAEDLDDADDKTVLDLPDMRVGKRGVEKSADRALRGKRRVCPGGSRRTGPSDARVGSVRRQTGRQCIIDDRHRVATVRGRSTREHQSGSVVVMDIVTGDIIAMVSTPGFDPNTFARGITQGEWRESAGPMRRSRSSTSAARASIRPARPTRS